MSQKAILPSRVSELLEPLRQARSTGQRDLNMHLFGIEHEGTLRTVSTSVIKQMLVEVGLKESLATEIRKGMDLAPFVTIKKKLNQ